MQTEGVHYLDGLNCEKIVSFIDGKKARGEELTYFDTYALRHVERNPAWLDLGNTKNEQEFVKYLRKNELMWDGAVFSWTTFKGWHESGRNMHCALRIGSDAYCRWARKRVCEMVGHLNNDVVSKRETLSAFIQSIPDGTFLYRNTMLAKINRIQPLAISEEDLAFN